ncbi:ParB/RepB/Spo0J family partition protein [Paenibacillus elgii]
MNDVEMTDLQAATAALTENIQRDDVTPIGVAREIDRMMKEFQMKQGDIAPKLGVTQAKVSQYLSLLCLAEPLLGMLERGELNQSIARMIVGVDEVGRS